MKTNTTGAEIADLVEFAINETKPQIKTRRGFGNEIELEINRIKFVVKVEKTPGKKKEAQIGK